MGAGSYISSNTFLYFEKILIMCIFSRPLLKYRDIWAVRLWVTYSLFNKLFCIEKVSPGWVQWLRSIILATQEAKILTITVQSQPRQKKVHKSPFQSIKKKKSWMWWQAPVTPAIQGS
jgi:hypothetical protein